MPIADCFLSVVVPLRDDGDIIVRALEDLVSVLRANFENYEIVLVDDGSTDDTRANLAPTLESEPGIRLLQLSRSFGQEIAIAAGLDAVIGDYIAVMLPDSDPPALIPEMVRTVRSGGGVAIGVRQGPVAQAWPTRLAARAFYWYCDRWLHIDLPKDGAIFRVMSRQAVNAVTRIGDRLRYIRAFTGFVGYEREEVPYTPISRRGRATPRGFLAAVATGIDVIVANSTHPLRLVSALGLAVSALSAAYVGYVLIAYAFSAEIAPGWVTRSVQTSVLFFFLFLIVAVLCEYVGRILAEIQNRPLYFVSEELHSTPTIEASQRRNVTTHSAERNR